MTATAYVVLRAGQLLPLPGRTYRLYGRTYRLVGVQLMRGSEADLRRWYPELAPRAGDRVLYVRLEPLVPPRVAEGTARQTARGE